MAKKSRRVRKTTKEESGEPSSSKMRDREAEFREEYAYVLLDLRRIFLLAVIMFALLIALNLFLQ